MKVSLFAAALTALASSAVAQTPATVDVNFTRLVIREGCKDAADGKKTTAAAICFGVVNTLHNLSSLSDSTFGGNTSLRWAYCASPELTYRDVIEAVARNSYRVPVEPGLGSNPTVYALAVLQLAFPCPK